MLEVTEKGEWAQSNIIDIQVIEVPENELLIVYNPSCTFIANGLFASCRSENDRFENFVEPASII